MVILMPLMFSVMFLGLQGALYYYAATTAGAAGNQGHFTVTVPEYDYVPGGTLQNVTKTVKSTYALAGVQQTLDLSAGTLTDTAVSNGVLSLGK